MPYAEIFSQNATYYNTGVNKDYLVPGFPHKLFFIPKDKQFTQTEEAVMFATLLAGISNNAAESRIYPLGNFTAMDDKSTDPVISTTSIGSQVFIRDGKYVLEFTYTKGGIQLHNKIRAMFHNAQDRFDLLWADKDTNTLIGTKAAANTSNYTKKGLTIDLIYVKQMKLNDGSAESKFMIGIVLSDPDEINERISISQLDQIASPLMSLNGLKDLEFVTFPQPYQVLTAGVAKIRITTGGGATELYSVIASGTTTFASALVALTANFSFKDAANNTLTCAVSLDAATNTLVFTFSGAAYTALGSGAPITCFSPTISQMTATIPGFANSSFTLYK